MLCCSMSEDGIAQKISNFNLWMKLFIIIFLKLMSVGLYFHITASRTVFHVSGCVLILGTVIHFKGCSSF